MAAPTDIERKFHEAWLGMAQPLDGLVVSVPVLVDAECFGRASAAIHERLRELCPEDERGRRAIADLATFFQDLLDLGPDRFEGSAALPPELSLYVPEGRQTIRPTLALRRAPDTTAEIAPGAETPASRAGAPYQLLVWDLAPHVGLSLDAAEALTGPWEYPPEQKFDRLLRACRVPIGLLTNREQVRLVYAPHGESSGSITFRIDDLARTDGRSLLDAFVLLLSANRLFAVAPERRLPAILAQSRLRQADVTDELADQILEALGLLVTGFDAAAERDGSAAWRTGLEHEDDHVYGGLLTVLLRLVFILYAEERDLLPVDEPLYSGHLSLLGLFSELQADQGTFPDSMSRRFGAWPRLVALFRAIFLGVRHGALEMPPRRGELFDPERFPFLEGRLPGGAAPISDAAERAQVHLPSLDDETVFRVLRRLLYLRPQGTGLGQRLSYRALDVEQIGSVYEALMGYHVRRLPSAAVCVRVKKTHLWVATDDLGKVPPGEREAWLVDEGGLEKTHARKVAPALTAAKNDQEILAALEPLRVKRIERAPTGRLVLVPGVERRRTSSHYTPRSLSEPIVRRTLEPLLASFGETPTSDQILSLQICDPAMGSGAFLVAACRFLGDQLIAAWTREGRVGHVGAAAEDAVTRARRLVAQRCLYGVDKNPFAVVLAKLAMWLATLAREEPFTFLDHALRHGDSLVGLDEEQIAAFHWHPERQLPLCHQVLRTAVAEALGKRRQILARAGVTGAEVAREKERLLEDADAALVRVRLLGDLVVGAFFAEGKGKTREAERVRRQDAALAWIASGSPPPPELARRQLTLRTAVPTFHWPIEFPEVFSGDRPNGPGFNAFVGNPPFAGKSGISDAGGPAYLPWLQALHKGAHGNADLSAHFFRRAFSLLSRQGTLGLIATKTIGQGDTRATGLQALLASGGRIYEATRRLKWPGEAAVTVSVVHIAKGSEGTTRNQLDERLCNVISSRLLPSPERPDPVALRVNEGLAFQGSIVLGMGFTLTPEERGALVKRDPRNAERIFPYLGGEEVNTSPTQIFDRYVINFGELPLAEAEHWPELLAIVREKVKPDRDKDKRDVRRLNWWRFGETTPALFAALAGKRRCLVNSIVSKHLIFAWQPTGRVFSHALYVFPLEDAAHFAVLQSRVHEPWARLLSSTHEERLRYAASDCLTTFPFPLADTMRLDHLLETLGVRLHSERAAYLVDTQQGLTDCYNELEDPNCPEPRVLALRALHEEVDRAVLAAYGWQDVEVPPYCAKTPAQDRLREAFDDEVIDRLFDLNHKRAEEESLAAPPAPEPKRPGRKKSAAQLDLLDK